MEKNDERVYEGKRITIVSIMRPTSTKVAYYVYRGKEPYKTTKLRSRHQIFGRGASCTFTIDPNVTANCQLGVLSRAYALNVLTIYELKEVIKTIFAGQLGYQDLKPIKRYSKSTILMDPYEKHTAKIIKAFTSLGAYVRANSPYTNRTGSKMNLLVIDLRGKSAYDN